MSNTDQKLRELAKRHAEISSTITNTSKEIKDEIELCNGGEYIKPENESGADFEFLFNGSAGLSPYPNCLNYTYETFKVFNNTQYDHYEYDELLFTYGCEHCQKARQLKKNVGKLKQERGRIHSAITQIGKTL
ncbi:TPA: hypothetical protein AB5C23_001257 [Vibrio cholerae]|nr:hypothetical protein VCSRO62_0333 [Vibrio cholerae]GHZ69099.1 hypothetical protein VCSRO127_0473 [Vibrio cholerae]